MLKISGLINLLLSEIQSAAGHLLLKRLDNLNKKEFLEQKKLLMLFQIIKK